MTEPQPPRRRPSPAVYRRRRLVVLLVLLAIAAGITWLLVAQPWSSAATDAAPRPAPTASAGSGSASPAVAASQTPAPTAEPTPAATEALGPLETPPPGCTRSDVAVEPVTDAVEYAADQNPQLSIRLTNNGDSDCTINVGTTTQKFTITSGNDTWWRSTDCQSEPSDMVVTLTAGQSVTSATPLTWDRTRSSVGSCADESRPRAAGGGASYHLSVEIGGIPSTGTAQFFLY